jgi:hypothetical protein
MSEPMWMSEGRANICDRCGYDCNDDCTIADADILHDELGEEQ